MTSRSTVQRKALAARPADVKPACLEATQLFQHTLLEDPPAVSAMSSAERRTAAMLQRQAEEKCLSCPLMVACLYDAVVHHDVAGYVAGTTHRQRLEIRTRLRIRVEAEDLDTLAGVIGPHRQVDHDEVVRLRNANPHESLEMIAQRLGCSLSTVKRHLRKARAEVAERPTRTLPSREAVLDAHRAVTAPKVRVGRAA